MNYCCSAVKRIAFSRFHQETEKATIKSILLILFNINSFKTNSANEELILFSIGGLKRDALFFKYQDITAAHAHIMGYPIIKIPGYLPLSGFAP